MIEKSKHKPLPEVSLYLYGEQLNPQLVSADLGLEPSKAWVKGYPTSKSNPEVRAKTGLWMIEISSSSSELRDHVDELLKILPKRSMLSVPGVTTAKIDVVVFSNSHQTFCGDLTSEQLIFLGQLGASFEFTQYCSECDEDDVTEIR